MNYNSIRAIDFQRKYYRSDFRTLDTEKANPYITTNKERVDAVENAHRKQALQGNKRRADLKLRKF